MMTIQSVIFGTAILTFFYAVPSAQLSQPSDPYYIGGVVEFPALPRETHLEDIIERLTQIRQLIEQATPHPDIIVFPESILNNVTNPVIVPDPRASIVPCANISYDYIITEISCFARSLHIYLLINVIEVESAQSAGRSASSTYFYNTNVVFDRQGVVISRYRKYNLIGLEWQYLNYTHQPELEATFDTDFNVTFGHFTRMDLLYYRPAQALVSKGIVNFLHPSKWQSELPFMTAIQLHQSWAYTNNVNLLVAGTNDPINGRTGTGIYAGKYGTLIGSITTDSSKRKLHLNVLPKTGYDLKHQFRVINEANNSSLQFTDRITGIKLGRESDIDLYVTLPLNDTDATELKHRLCHVDLCCDFHLRRFAIQPHTNGTQSSVVAHSYQYRIAVFRGTGTFLNTEPDVLAVCAVFACVGDHIYTCGRIFDEATLVENRFAFEFIKISGNFTQPADSLVLPTSVDGMLMPLPTSDFDFNVQVESNLSIVSYRLIKPKADLLTFGIYVNYFIDESIYDQHKNNVATKFKRNKFIYVLLIFVYIELSK